MKTKHVELVTIREYTELFPPERLADLPAWVDRLTASVPEEFRDIARIEFSYADPGIDLDVSWARPLTAEETEREERKARGIAAAEEHRRRAQYEVLKAEFERAEIDPKTAV